MIRDNHCTTGKTGPAIVPIRHCEPVGRGNLQHHLSSLIAPINIVYPELSILTYLSVYPTAAMEIATALRPRNDGGDRWLIPFRPGAAVSSAHTAERRGRRSLRGNPPEMRRERPPCRSAVQSGINTAPPAKGDQLSSSTVIARPDRAVAISSTMFRNKSHRLTSYIQDFRC